MTTDNIYYNSLYQTRYVGSNQDDNPYIQLFFSKNVIDLCSKKITQMLKERKSDKFGRDIIVPDKRILEYMNTIWDSYNAPIGFDQNRSSSDFLNNLIGQVISRIVYEVDSTLGVEQAFSDYKIWNTVYGDFNEQGLRSHAPVKIRHKRPNSFEFNMRY